MAESNGTVRSSTAAPKPIAPFILVRAIIAAAAAGAALYHLTGGEASIPLWIWKLGARAGVDGFTTVRLLASVEMTIALVVLLSSRLAKPVAFLALATLAFGSIAELSARWGSGTSVAGFIGPFAALVVAGALLASRARWAPPADASRTAPIGVGSVLVAVGLLFFSLGAAARLPVADQPRRDVAHADASHVRFPSPDRWVGRTLPDVGISAILPVVTSETLEGDHILVFYSTRCGMCHDLFRNYFGVGPNPIVIAIEVPPEVGIELLESDQPEDIECPGCRRMALPAGPAYFQHLPLVVAVRDGRVTCVEWRDPERCLPH